MKISNLPINDLIYIKGYLDIIDCYSELIRHVIDLDSFDLDLLESTFYTYVDKCCKIENYLCNKIRILKENATDEAR